MIIVTKIDVIILLMVMFVGMIIGIYASILWGRGFNKILIRIFRSIFPKKPTKEAEKIIITSKITRYPKDKGKTI